MNEVVSNMVGTNCDNAKLATSVGIVQTHFVQCFYRAWHNERLTSTNTPRINSLQLFKQRVHLSSASLERPEKKVDVKNKSQTPVPGIEALKIRRSAGGLVWIHNFRISHVPWNGARRCNGRNSVVILNFSLTHPVSVQSIVLGWQFSVCFKHPVKNSVRMKLFY